MNASKGCDYCLWSHDRLGRKVARLSDSEIDAARDGRSQDARANAAALRMAGFDEAGVIKIVVTVALNVLTNYVNNVAQIGVDFPKVSAMRAA